MSQSTPDSSAAAHELVIGVPREKLFRCWTEPALIVQWFTPPLWKTIRADTSAWVPSGKPFFTCILTFEDEGGKTRYTARARHWNAEDCKAHETTGFHVGWGIAKINWLLWRLRFECVA